MLQTVWGWQNMPCPTHLLSPVTCAGGAFQPALRRGGKEKRLASPLALSSPGLEDPSERLSLPMDRSHSNGTAHPSSSARSVTSVTPL